MLVAPGPMEVVHTSVTQTIVHFREPCGGMHHRLLIAAQIVGEIQVLLQGLPDSSYIAMTEDAETTCEEQALVSVARYVLDFKELDDGLRHCQSSRHGFLTSVPTIFIRRALVLRTLTSRNRNWAYARDDVRNARRPKRILQFQAKRYQTFSKAPNRLGVWIFEESHLRPAPDRNEYTAIW